MSELRTIECKRREPCVYCGATNHPAPFACPRVKAVTSYGDGVIEVELFPYDSPPPEPEAA